jgi:hypothetical protein
MWFCKFYASYHRTSMLLDVYKTFNPKYSSQIRFIAILVHWVYNDCLASCVDPLAHKEWKCNAEHIPHRAEARLPQTNHTSQNKMEALTTAMCEDYHVRLIRSLEHGVGLSIQPRRVNAIFFSSLLYRLLERTIHIPRSLVLIGTRQRPPAIENDLTRAGWMSSGVAGVTLMRCAWHNALVFRTECFNKNTIQSPAGPPRRWCALALSW